MEGVGRMAYSNLGDVDYLVEDNVMDDFCLSPEMEETHGRMAHWRCCWKYALEAIIKVLLLYFLVHDNCLLFML